MAARYSVFRIEVLIRFNADSTFPQCPSPILARHEALAAGFEAGNDGVERDGAGGGARSKRTDRQRHRVLRGAQRDGQMLREARHDRGHVSWPQAERINA